MADPKTEELQVDQLRREGEERLSAEDAGEPAEESQHERRADKAAYLRDKLAERAAAEEREA
jgi:hypothetical protein